MKQEFVTLPREVVEQALDAWARGCPPDCKDGMTDSGGVHPWGEAALIECPSCQAVEALRAALEQPQDHVPDAGNMVPEGWKLVPVEPTKEMKSAGAFAAARANAVSYTPAGKYIPVDAMSLMSYSAMLDAAPQPPVVKQPQIDWHDMYLKERRRAEMWIAKYEQDIGKLEVAVPVAAQPQVEQEPVAWIENLVGALSYNPYHEAARKLPEGVRFDLYTRPHPRQPLTDEKIGALARNVPSGYNGFAQQALYDFRAFARAIEAAHNIK